MEIFLQVVFLSTIQLFTFSESVHFQSFGRSFFKQQSILAMEVPTGNFISPNQHFICLILMLISCQLFPFVQVLSHCIVEGLVNPTLTELGKVRHV